MLGGARHRNACAFGRPAGSTGQAPAGRSVGEGPHSPRNDGLSIMSAGDKRASRLDEVVAEARRQAAIRERDYRARALKMYPWVCGRCGREFTRENLRELTVHHRDHNHDNNPQDGSNWELLCVYCHDNEHARYVDHVRGAGYEPEPTSDEATHRPFAGLEGLLRKRG